MQKYKSNYSYDSQNRLQYTPDLHKNRGRPWSTHEESYVIGHYDLLGAEQMSFALERPITAICNRVYELRKAGKMKKPSKQSYHRRHCRPVTCTHRQS